MTLRSGIHVGVVAAAAVMAAGSCEGGGNSWQHSMLVSGLVVVPSVGEVFAPDAVLPRSPLRAAFLGNAPHFPLDAAERLTPPSYGLGPLEPPSHAPCSLPILS